MPSRKNPMNPLAAVAAGLLAGAAGTLAAYGIVAGSLPSPDPQYGVPFGAAVFVGDYIALPAAGLYKPIWEYDVKTLAWDLGAHLAYGAGTGTAFWLLTRKWVTSHG